MDMIWTHLRPKLLQVTSIALFLLTIPHSNAAEERVFSMIGKNNTKFWSILDLATPLNTIMLIKMNRIIKLVEITIKNIHPSDYVNRNPSV